MERAHFNAEIETVNNELLEMGTRVEEALGMALQALKAGDLELAKGVKAKDAAVDELQHRIEDHAAVIMATQSPVAGDLRFLVALFKAADNLERCGDHAVHLAKAVKKFADRPPLPQVERLELMAEIGRDMVRGAVAAFRARDIEAARAVAAMDDRIDHEHKSLVQEVLEVMKVRPDEADRAAKLLSTSAFLERLGDHVTNLCEAVIYMVEGIHVELNE